MKLNYGKNFRQFFFVTVAVAGRREALSRLAGEGERPVLSPLGEAVAAALRSLHRVNPAVTLSDYVIMPDHFHFIMIIDYSRDKIASPLYLTHRLLDAVEGWMESTGAEPPCFPPPLFERSPYIELSFDSRQLKAIRRYIKLNPARALWKKRHPDLFLCHRDIKARRFAQFAGVRFDGIGNLTLLGSPFLHHVRLTLKKTVAEHQPAIEELVEKARHGVVAVSGFISPGERELLRRLKAEPGARFIKLLPCALPSRYDPSAEDSREIAAGRMAIISAFPDTPAISSQEMRRNSSAAHAFRANCLAMNGFAERLCAGGICPQG
ncbi:MAG: hypothetical protein K6F50_10475 [Kiritimatiellae bacterium]|nr:hypothetical protein [Kiritimatiellia bacterium]